MTITRDVQHYPVMRKLLLCTAIVSIPFGSACAWQSGTTPSQRPTTVVIAPPPSVQYQQTVQQQQTRDQLQKSQLEQQLHQGVSDNAKRPSANDPRSQQQLDQADQAQQDRDRASQQALLERQQHATELPRVIPRSLPASSRSG
jgi:DNA gyrase/topoisomerase IV subunit B